MLTPWKCVRERDNVGNKVRFMAIECGREKSNLFKSPLLNPLYEAVDWECMKGLYPPAGLRKRKIEAFYPVLRSRTSPYLDVIISAQTPRSFV